MKNLDKRNPKYLTRSYIFLALLKRILPRILQRVFKKARFLLEVWRIFTQCGGFTDHSSKMGFWNNETHMGNWSTSFQLFIEDRMLKPLFLVYLQTNVNWNRTVLWKKFFSSKGKNPRFIRSSFSFTPLISYGKRNHSDKVPTERASDCYKKDPKSLLNMLFRRKINLLFSDQKTPSCHKKDKAFSKFIRFSQFR